MISKSALGLKAGDTSPIVVNGDRVITRGELRARADSLLDFMAQHGVTRLMALSDDPEHILRAIDAADRSGADLYIAHTNLPQLQIDALIDKFGIQLVVGTEDRLSGQREPGPVSTGRVFMMTSGTTGVPKVASHSLAGLMSRARGGMSPRNRGAKWLLTYQPTGFAGIQVQLTAVIGDGLIVAPHERSPSGFVQAARANSVAQISATPTFWRSFLMAVRPGEVALRQITLGGEAADQSTLNRVKKAFPDAHITHIYASTEAGVVFAVHDGREGFPAEWLSAPVQGVELRIADGFLHIRTPNAMGGYVSDTAQPLSKDGWLATADRVDIRGDRAFIVGRDDSTINVGGSKVYPLMVEQFLLKQPGVLEARVFGVPSPIAGAIVAGEIVIDKALDPVETRANVLAACREGLASYQVPRTFKVVDAIVVKQSGKKG